MIGKSSLLLWIMAATSVSTADVIQTATGPVQGIRIQNALGKFVTLFSGIPYAEPPIGQLRFKPPVPVTPWTEIIKSSERSNACVQRIPPWLKDSINGTSEDCLTLNIWINNPHKAAVIVYIHGGGYTYGYSMSTRVLRSTITSEENVILVSVNYRINVLGFMGLGIHEAPGNVGLMDQNLALKWIRENIAAFGGNPNSITLMGLSAGSTSVGYHLLSTKSKGLFQRAILMSGVPNCILHKEPEFSVAKTKMLAKSFGCDISQNAAILDCLMNVSARDLVEKEKNLSTSHQDLFRPTVDGHFVTEDPAVSLEAGRLNPLPILIGTTSKEGGFLLKRHEAEVFKDDEGAMDHKGFDKVVGSILNSDPDSVRVKAVGVLYTNWTTPDDPSMIRDAAVKSIGDYVFVCTTNTFCDRVSKSGATVYRYLYDRKDPASKDWLTPAHGSDLPFVLGSSLGKEGQTEEDVLFGRRMMKHWANFARTGDPNIPGEDIQWPKYDISGRRLLRLAHRSSVGSHFKVQDCAFLDQLLPRIKDSDN